MAGDMDGQVAFITGAARGIGRAIAWLFARKGANIIAVDWDATGLENVQREIEALGRAVMIARVAVSDFVAVAGMIDSALARFGKLDILINNAAIIRRGSFLDHTKEDWDLVLKVNLGGTFNCVKAIVPHMVKQGGGSVINMGTSYSIRCEPGFLAYAASKEALRALTRTAAREWGKQGIRVNTILPSALTPKSIWYLEESGTYDFELSKVAMGRFGTPQDIAPTCVFLASDESNFVTGQTIGVEGGAIML